MSKRTYVDMAKYTWWQREEPIVYQPLDVSWLTLQVREDIEASLTPEQCSVIEQWKAAMARRIAETVDRQIMNLIVYGTTHPEILQEPSGGTYASPQPTSEPLTLERLHEVSLYLREQPRFRMPVGPLPELHLTPGSVNVVYADDRAQCQTVPRDDHADAPDDTELSWEQWNAKVDALLEECRQQNT